MFLETFEKYLAILLLGMIIKLLDDEIDGDKHDKKLRSKIYSNITEYKLPYCLLFMSFSMLLQPQLVFSLFTSAYMIGMFHFPNQKLPLKLKGYQEVIVLIIINILWVSLEIFLVAFVTILLIQLIDDLMDYKYDFKYGYKNFVNKFGRGEIIILSTIFLIMALMISWNNSLIILSSSFLINYLYSKM